MQESKLSQLLAGLEDGSKLFFVFEFPAAT